VDKPEEPGKPDKHNRIRKPLQLMILNMLVSVSLSVFAASVKKLCDWKAIVAQT